jgi:adhesin/invasin
VVTTGALANGTATNSVQAHITDANGNALAGQSVTFAIASGAGTFVGSATVTTDASGNAVITLTSTVAGSVGITATVGVSNIPNGSPATVAFVLDPPSTSSPLTALSVLSTGALANGSGTNSVQAHIADAGGIPLASQSVIFTIANGTGTFVGSDTVITGANGNAVISLTSTVVGSVNITATVGGNSITNGSPATVSFINPTPVVTDTLTALSVVTTGALANGVSTNSVKAHVVDSDSIPIKNQSVTFSIASGSGTFVGSAMVVTDSNGNAVISLTSIVVGAVNITATVGGNAITFGSPAIVNFINDTASVNDSATRLVVVTTNAVANGIAKDSIKAHVADSDSIPVANQTVIFTIANGNGNFVGSDTVTTDANGNAVISLTSTVAGSVGITATVNNNAIVFGSPAVVVFVAGSADTSASATALSVVTNNAAANGTATNSVKAHISDANGNAVGNQQVIFTIANGTANFVGSDTVTTDSNGNAIIMLTSIVADTVVDITATVNGQQIIHGSPASVIFTNKPDVTNNKTTLIVLVSEAIADGQSTTSVKAHIADQSGNSLAGATVVFAIDSGTAQIITAQPVITDSNGDATILITSLKPGFVLITAQVDSQQIINGSPARVQFAAINIYVPKVFTPNGDGTNDILKPILVGISSFHYFSVYNRWGNLIFTTEDPNAGWDGSFKGVPQPVETYLWIGEGVDINGKKVVQKGMVSLVR